MTATQASQMSRRRRVHVLGTRRTDDTPKKEVKQKTCGLIKADLNQALEEPHTGTWEDPDNGNLAATIRRPAMQIFNTSSHAAF